MAKIEMLQFKAKRQVVIVLPNGQPLVANKEGDKVEVHPDYALFMAGKADDFEAANAASKKLMRLTGVSAFADLVAGEGDDSGDPITDPKDAEKVREAATQQHQERSAEELGKVAQTVGTDTTASTNWGPGKGPHVKTAELDTGADASAKADEADKLPD